MFFCLSPKERFSWPENGYIIFLGVTFLKKSVVINILEYVFHWAKLQVDQILPKNKTDDTFV
jgi:hypothetical protein